MPTLEEWTLWLHVTAGMVAVLAGLGALVTTKGGWRHRRAGRVFVASMGIVVATVFILLVFDPTTFRIILALVAIFSGYLAFSGYRVLSRKRPRDDADLIDWGAAASVAVACLGLGLWGVNWAVSGQSFGFVMIVFGGIGLGFAAIDARSFRQESDGKWMVTHLQRMVGAYIATISAVSAVNLTTIVGIAAWLWPTAAGIPLIVYWSNKYESEGSM